MLKIFRLRRCSFLRVIISLDQKVIIFVTQISHFLGFPFPRESTIGFYGLSCRGSVIEGILRLRECFLVQLSHSGKVSMEFLTVISPFVLKVGKIKGGISVTVRKTLIFYLGHEKLILTSAVQPRCARGRRDENLCYVTKLRYRWQIWSFIKFSALRAALL